MNKAERIFKEESGKFFIGHPTLFFGGLNESEEVADKRMGKKGLRPFVDYLRPCVLDNMASAGQPLPTRTIRAKMYYASSEKKKGAIAAFYVD